DLPFFVFAFTTLPASRFLAVNAQPGRFIRVKQAYSFEGANFAFCCSNARFQTYIQLGSKDRVTWRQSSTP
ncbi:hypothetical protein K443DRAFT_91381, partial [Laccaria amethystina LaAM-08-1]